MLRNDFKTDITLSKYKSISFSFQFLRISHPNSIGALLLVLVGPDQEAVGLDLEAVLLPEELGELVEHVVHVVLVDYLELPHLLQQPLRVSLADCDVSFIFRVVYKRTQLFLVFFVCENEKGSILKVRGFESAF